jgi:lysophospholipase L1-like esterase
LSFFKFSSIIFLVAKALTPKKSIFIMAGSRSHVRKRILAIILGLGVALAALEILLRLFPLPLPDRFFEAHADFGWFHIPGRAGLQAGPEFSVPIQINQNGLRGHEVAYQKPEGSFRILLLGDSFVEGLQVPLEETLAYQLETLLNSAENRFEVINAGVSRYSTANELLYFQHEGKRYDPDLVFLFFFRNDLEEALDQNFFRLENGELIEVNTGVRDIRNSEAVRGWLWDHLQMYRLSVVGGTLIKTLLTGESTFTNPINRVYARKLAPELEASWLLTEQLLLALSAEVENQDAIFILVGISDPASYKERGGSKYDLTQVNRHLGLIAMEAGIEYIDLYPYFLSQPSHPPESFFWPGDGHWNAKGHALTAEILAEAVDEVLSGKPNPVK